MFSFAFAAISLFATFDVVLVAAAVAVHAVIKLTDALLDMLAPDIGHRMFMASIAGVATVDIAQVAGDATGILVTVQPAIFVMFKIGLRPLLLGVALTTVAGDRLVQGVGR